MGAVQKGHSSMYGVGRWQGPSGVSAKRLQQKNNAKLVGTLGNCTFGFGTIKSECKRMPDAHDHIGVDPWTLGGEGI